MKETASSKTSATPARSRQPWAFRLAKGLALFLIIAVLLLIYASSLIGVTQETKRIYRSLKAELSRQGHQPRLFVISGRRYWLDNLLLTALSGASRNSRHLEGDAVDIVVLDVNDDGAADGKDVDIVYQILDRQLIGNQGGIGIYKNESNFFSRQMVHFDLRGRRARWVR